MDTRAPILATILVVSSCVVGGSAPPPGTVTLSADTQGNTQPVGPVAQPAPGGHSRRLSLAWSDVAQTPGCFFFSGPGDLGRDTHLGDAAQLVLEGGVARLEFDVQTVFTQLQEGVLVRRGSYSHGAAVWTTEETITGRYEGLRFVGQYRYNECDPSGTETCPGRCVITASIVGQ